VPHIRLVQLALSEENVANIGEVTGTARKQFQ
jgi:hypothetical protein